MKVIDLLNKIANGEEVPRFIVKGKDYYEEEYEYVFEYYNSLRNATCGKWVEAKIDNAHYRKINSAFLNKEVEIIEEEKKIPEKIDVWYEPIKDIKLERHDTDTSIEILANMCDDLKDKCNEIIDYLQSKGE